MRCRPLIVAVALVAGCSTETQVAQVQSFDLTGLDLTGLDLAGVDFAGLPPFDLSETDGGPDLSVQLDLAGEDLSVTLNEDMAVSRDMKPPPPDMTDMTVLAADIGSGHILDLGSFDLKGTACAYPNICQTTEQCNGYFSCPKGYDPCKPHYCDIGSACSLQTTLPNNTPCDDSRGCSFMYPAIAGCPSNRCVGGNKHGQPCSNDSQCTGGGTCFMNRCLGGSTPNTACSTNKDCTGGAGNADCLKVSLGGAQCNGGSEVGHHCRLLCVGGILDGSPCVDDNDCFDGAAGACPNITSSTDCPPAGRCVRWSADPVTKTCTANADNPFCNTVNDCPTTKYCAGDPESRASGATSCYDDATDDCCPGGTPLGPCLVWDSCDTANHLCVRTTQGNVTSVCGAKTRYTYGPEPCAGGLLGVGGQGDGGVCNNVCVSGVCSSTSLNCPP
jgi:hypothetical protein